MNKDYICSFDGSRKSDCSIKWMETNPSDLNATRLNLTYKIDLIPWHISLLRSAMTVPSICFVSPGAVAAVRLRGGTNSFINPLKRSSVRIASRRIVRASVSTPSNVGTQKGNGLPPSTTTSAKDESSDALRDILLGVRELSKPLWGGNRRGVAWGWTAAALLLSFGTTIYAAAMSIQQRMFWNALNARDLPKFQKLMVFYVMFVIVGPIVLSLFEWVKARLALMWRGALTNHFVSDYLDDSTHYRLQARGSPVDNPDQRIADDIRTSTERCVRFFCVGIVAVFDLLVFSVLLYKVYPPLLATVVIYSAVGTTIIAVVGRRLVPLNRQQLAREADFRYALIRVRESSESIAFYQGEKAESTELKSRFGSLVSNALRLYGRSRDVMFLSASHRYWAQIVPITIIGPAYFNGTLELGSISQMFFSFNHVLSSLGIAVTEFANLAEFSAGVRRLRQLSRRMSEENTRANSDDSRRIARAYDVPNSSAELSVSNLCLETPRTPKRALVQEISFRINQGQRLLIVGTSGVGKSSLLRALAGLWESGTGSIHLPAREDTLFLPQKPFISLGTLRDNVLYPTEQMTRHVSDEEIQRVLSNVNLKHISERMGGLDAPGETLVKRMSLGEQQRLAFARVLIKRPRFLVGDEFTSALDLENERLLYSLLRGLGITCISVGNRPSLLEFHDTVIHLMEDGAWNVEEPSDTAERLNIALSPTKLR